MRWKTAVAAAAVLATVAACSDKPEATTAAGVPERWYTTVDQALADRPDVTAVGQLESGGRCPLRDQVPLDGKKVEDLSDHGVVRLGGDIPAVLCSWYEDTVVEVEVAHAPDAARYDELVAGTHAVDQPGNEQTEQDVTVDGRTIRVVRTVYPTNPSAGTKLSATLLDEPSHGRVRLDVGNTDKLDGYDQHAIATDLIALLAG